MKEDNVNPSLDFQKEVLERLKRPVNPELERASKSFMLETLGSRYSYNFSWMSRPIIQYPQDIVAMQELIWEVKPDLIIETGIAHGGSILFSASMLALIDMAEAVEAGITLNPKASKRKVLAIDIDIRANNRSAIEAHPLASRIQMIEGSSISSETAKEVNEIAKNFKTVMICLDSNHTHDHVLKELELYAHLTSVNSYCVVFDTVVEDMPKDWDWGVRPWGVGNNPKTAVHEFLKTNNQFQIDKSIDNKLLISVAPDGYLKRIS